MSEEQFYNQWLNRNNFKEVWGHIKGKFVSGYFTQTGSGYNADWRAKARTNIGLGTPAEGSIWIGGGASTPITTLATSAHGCTILSSTLSAGEIWYGVDNSTLGKVVSTALGRRLMAATIGANEIWYGSAANTLDVVTTTPFGRGLLSAASQEVVTNLYADRAKYDLRGSEISATYGKDLAIDTSGTDAYLKLKNNAATSAFIGTGIIINKASGLVQLDSNAHIPLGLFPDSILGQLTYGGTVSAYSSDTRIQIVMTASAKRIMEQRKGYAAKTLDGKNIYLENLATPTTHTLINYYFNYADCKGMYFIWTEAALDTHTGEVKYRDWAGERYESGDWLTTNEEAWKKVDNTDAVTAVKGKMQSDWQTGNVELDALKVGALATYLTNTTQTVQDNVNFKKNVSVDGGVSAEGLCDLSLGGIGGGSGTVQSVQIGSGSPISPAQGSGGNVILAVETPSANGRIKLGGTEIAVSGLAALAYKANLSLSELQNATDIQAIQTISTGTANGFLVRASDGTWSFDTSQYAASSRVSTLEGYFSSGILKPANMPVATGSALGGVKVGASLAISSGVLNVKTGGVTNDMLAGSIANNKLANSSISLAGRTINLGDTVTQANLRSDLGLGTAAYKADTYFAKQTDFESAVMTLSGGLGTLQSMIEDNKASIEGHDDRITDLEGYFTDGIPTGAVDAVGFANNQFTWSKGGVAQTPFTIGYATEAGKATNDKNGNDITATYLPLTGGVLKPTGGNTPLGLQPKNSSDVDVNMAYMNGGGTAMGYIGVKVVNNVSTPYFKATASGTAYGLIHEGNKNSLFTLFENDNEQLSATVGGVNKKVTVDYASKATDIKNEDKENQTFVFRQTAGGALTYAPTSANLMRVKGNTLVWNQGFKELTSGNWKKGSDNVSSITFSNGVATIETLASGSNRDLRPTDSYSFITGHKYYISYDAKANTSISVQISSYTSNGYVLDSRPSATVTTSYVGMSYVLTAVLTVNTALRFTNASNIAATIDFKNIVLVDLTLLYSGEDISGLTDEQLLAKFEADYAGYYSYNEGQLINNAAEGLETVGFNQWDEEWEKGSMSSEGTEVASETAIRNKGYVKVRGNTQYYFRIGVSTGMNIFFYDGNKNFISRINGIVLNNAVFTTPSNACYIRFNLASTYGTTYNHDICINFSNPAKNGTYESYKRNVLDLHLDNIQVKSHNIWDEEWEAGGIDSTTGVVDDSMTDRIRSKNYIPIKSSVDYYYCNKGDVAGTTFAARFYDKDKNYIGFKNAGGNSIYPNSAFVPPANAAYIRFMTPTSYGTTYNNDICINESSSFNGQYEPHGILTINGLKQAGNVRDEIVGNKYIKRVGDVDLGTLTYGFSYADSYHIFQVNNMQNYVPNFPSHISGGIGAISTKFTNVTWEYIASYSSNGCDKVFCLDDAAMGTNALVIRDTTYSDAATFKTAMSGVMLYYELATPETYELVDPFPTSYPIDVLGTESIVSDGLVAPFVADIRYGAKQGDILASGIPWDRIWNKPSTLAAFGITDAKIEKGTVTGGEWFKVTLGDKNLYIRFVTGTGAFNLEIADNDTNPTLTKSFEFGTLTTAEINTICS